MGQKVSPFPFQSSMSASLRPFWGWTSCARPSQAWEKQQCLSWPHCNSWSQLLGRYVGGHWGVVFRAGLLRQFMGNDCFVAVWA